MLGALVGFGYELLKLDAIKTLAKLPELKLDSCKQTAT
jgi:hypothetical protein